MKWTLIILISILVACSEHKIEKYPRYEKFPEEIKLTGEVLPLDTALFRYAYRIEIKDSIALIMDLHNIDYYFHAFTYPGFKHIVSFGKRGEGPEEILSPSNIRYVSDDSIWTLDTRRMKMTRWHLFPSSREIKKKEDFSITRKKILALDMAITEDTTFFLPDYSGSCSFYEVNTKGELVDSVGMLPTELHPVEPSRITLGQVWMRFVDYNPNNHIMALASQLGEVLEIYNRKTKEWKIIYGPNGEPIYRIVRQYAIPFGIKGFDNIRITDNYIYAAFDGSTFKEIAKILKKGKTPTFGCSSIYVFDLKGNPIRKYVLDHHIHGFYVDETNKIITGLDMNKDEPVIQFRL